MSTRATESLLRPTIWGAMPPGPWFPVTIVEQARLHSRWSVLYITPLEGLSVTDAFSAVDSRKKGFIYSPITSGIVT